MQTEVVVKFDPYHEYQIPVQPDAVMPLEAARDWLDQQFIALDAEPIRASGKVLSADKVLAVAVAAGFPRFRDEPVFAARFAEAALGSLDKKTLIIDVESMTVQF